MNHTSGAMQISIGFQRLLGKLVRDGVLELKPEYRKDGIHYPVFEENSDEEAPVNVEEALRSLVEQGALDRVFIERVLTCPECGSPHLRSKYACPKCESYNVEYTRLIEHARCGYIGSESEFLKNSSRVCPRCQAIFPEKVRDEALRVIGSSYRCERCGYSFDKPEVVHICQQCNRNFTHRDAEYIKAFSYRITDETVNEFRENLPIFESIGKILSEKGFKIHFHTQLTGTTGVHHPFDVVARRGETLLVADASLSGDKNDAVSLLGKKMDVEPTLALLIDLSDREELFSLEQIYGIKVLKAGEESSIKRELGELLANLDSHN